MCGRGPRLGATPVALTWAVRVPSPRPHGAADGTYHRTYESYFDSSVIALPGDGYRVRITHRDDPSDRFSRLWEEFAAD